MVFYVPDEDQKIVMVTCVMCVGCDIDNELNN